LTEEGAVQSPNLVNLNEIDGGKLFENFGDAVLSSENIQSKD